LSSAPTCWVSAISDSEFHRSVSRQMMSIIHGCRGWFHVKEEGDKLEFTLYPLNWLEGLCFCIL
jgi:hypothetical protein